MQEYNFIPKWYLDKIKEKNRIIIKGVMAFLLILNIVLAGVYSLCSFNLNNIDDEVQIAKSHKDNNEEIRIKKKDVVTLKNYKIIYEELLKKYKFKEVNIEGNLITLSVEALENEYLNIIKELDEDNKYTISSISEPKLENGKYNFNVVLEVGK